MNDNEKMNELLIKVSLSDRKAFSELYNLSSSKLFAISFRILKEKSLAEDVLQESFLQVWNKASRYDVKKSLAMTWMGTIVRNKSIDLIRKRHKDEYNIELDESLIDSEDASIDPENLAITNSMLKDVSDCMAYSKNEYNKVIIMAYLEGYSHQQIATKIGKPIGTIKTWISRGVDKLKKCLKVKYET